MLYMDDLTAGCGWAAEIPNTRYCLRVSLSVSQAVRKDTLVMTFLDNKESDILSFFPAEIKVHEQPLEIRSSDFHWPPTL